jgi:hypothetical protein
VIEQLTSDWRARPGVGSFSIIRGRTPRLIDPRPAEKEASMETHPRHPQHRSRFVTLWLALALVLAALGLTHCRGIQDPVTGVDVRDNATYGRGHGRSECEHQCANDYRRCKSAERHRHEKALRACRKLKDEDRKKCRDEEQKLHEARKAECSAERRACRADCRYNEGGGKGGR